MATLKQNIVKQITLTKKDVEDFIKQLIIKKGFITEDDLEKHFLTVILTSHEDYLLPEEIEKYSFEVLLKEEKIEKITFDGAGFAITGVTIAGTKKDLEININNVIDDFGGLS